jgi:hypothetical protein
MHYTNVKVSPGSVDAKYEDEQECLAKACCIWLEQQLQTAILFKSTAFPIDAAQ